MNSTVTADPLTPVSFLRRAATVFGERPAVVDGDTRLSYTELWQRVRRLTGALRGLGVQPGDRVAVLAPNTRMHLEAHHGVPLAGAVLVALNLRLTAEELSYIVDHSGARVLLYDEALADLAENIPVPNKVSSAEYERALRTAEPDEVWPEDEHGLLAIDYTSGTTGRPKGVMYSHRGAYLQALAMAYHARLDSGSRYLWTLPMFHCNGWSFPWAVTAAGAAHVCLRKVDPTVVWELIEREGVTHFCAAPTVLIDLASSPAARPAAQPVWVGTGGAPPAPSLLARFDELGVEIIHLYGLTETYGPSVVSEFPAEYTEWSIEDQASFKARQGNVNIAGTALRVIAEDGSDVPADGRTMGEVVIRGNTVAQGYYRDPEATASAFESGYFRTGDLGVMHPDNYVELRDRAKDVIISGGENISSIEVEQVLLGHPEVREAAVVAAPHQRWGEVPHAFVTPTEGAELTAEKLISYVRGSLPGFKTPKHVEFCSLPKTSTGKVQKFLLRRKTRDEAKGS